MIRLWTYLLLFLFANVGFEVSATKRFARDVTASDLPLTNTSYVLKDGDACSEDSISNIVCENDRLMFCGPNNKIMSTPCEINGRQAFCNCEKDDCVPQKPSCSEETTTCLTPNTKLPDNLNCHKFSYCDENKIKSVLECPGNLIYDPEKGKCLDQNTSPCNRIVCPRPGTRLQLIPFPQARNYYVLCFQGMGDVRKCPFKNYAVRNNKCQFDCKLQNGSGLFRDTDVNKCRQGYYYSCRRAGTNFTTVQAKCPTGKIFNEDLGLCTDQDTCVA